MKKFNFAKVNDGEGVASIEEVEKFLHRMKEKIRVFGIIYRDDRGKNMQTLATLEITPMFRDKVILKLRVEDYSEGPLIDSINNFGELWVFGKDVKNNEVYIKISLDAGTNALCISFHIAEYKMQFPYKN